MISQYDKDMCCLYIAEGMTYIWQQRGNQELSRILESLADRKLMKRVPWRVCDHTQGPVGSQGVETSPVPVPSR